MSFEILSMPEQVELKLQLLDRLIRIAESEGNSIHGAFIKERAANVINSIERDLMPESSTDKDVNVGNLIVKVTAETTPEFDELLKKIGEHTSESGKLIAEALENLKIKVAEG
ncbi:hypothetical protein [Paenibacillus ihumii]|uniref:hypothetical protein n=1 Tax=Paenibacillus ihumii TaxID=687436 RepID=UPI0006D7FEA8|nr:hypothetical protein [Paenibacillus ihumii]